MFWILASTCCIILHDEYPLHFFSPVSQLMDVQVVSTHYDCNKVINNLMYVPLWSCVRTYYRLLPDEELTGHSVFILLLSLRSTKLFSNRVAALVLTLISNISPHSQQYLTLPNFLNFFPVRCKVDSHYCFNIHFSDYSWFWVPSHTLVGFSSLSCTSLIHIFSQFSMKIIISSCSFAGIACIF